ncbi:MAG: hypothetical protein U0V70_08775 [Terriglobia bacterium]
MPRNLQLFCLSCILVIGVACSGPSVTSSYSTGESGSSLNKISKDLGEKKLEETLAAGTIIQATLEDSLRTDKNVAGDSVHLKVTDDVKREDVILIPRGSTVNGVVKEARRSGRVKGLAYMALQFTEVVLPSGQSYPIQATMISRQAPNSHKRDALMIGGGAGAGALIGAIAGGGKGAAIGAGAGGAAGTGAVLVTRGKETGFPSGSPIQIKLTQPLKLAVS